jgi:hypothetical protein
MAPEPTGWSAWLTPQQSADLTGLGGDFGGDATAFLKLLFAEVRRFCGLPLA